MAWLDAQALAQASPVFGPGTVRAPEGASLAVEAWNLMGGIDWAALPVVAELFGIADVETFIHQLVAIRDHQRKQSENG